MNNFKILRITGSIVLALVAFAVLLSLNTSCSAMDSAPGAKKHNKLATLFVETQTKWANVEVAVERRHALIPNLVSTVKAQAAHEKETLQAVVEARSKATSIQLEAKDLADPKKMQQYAEAQAQLSGALSRLMMVQEKYPELRSSEAFRNLRFALEGSENRIAAERGMFNESCGAYNAELAIVSGIAMNGITGEKFKPCVFYKASQAANAGAPVVEF